MHTLTGFTKLFYAKSPNSYSLFCKPVIPMLFWEFSKGMLRSNKPNIIEFYKANVKK